MWLLRESDIWADISEGGEVVKQVKSQGYRKQSKPRMWLNEIAQGTVQQKKRRNAT